MKVNQTTIYCDATGQEIENEYDMLTVDINKSTRTLTAGEGTVHLSTHAHAFPYEQLVERDFLAYADRDDRVVMIEESSTTRVTYHGPQTEDSAVRGLINTLNEAVSIGDAQSPDNATATQQYQVTSD